MNVEIFFLPTVSSTSMYASLTSTFLMDQLRLAYLWKLNPACIRYGLCGLTVSSEPDHYRPNPSPLMLWHTRLSRMYVTGKHTYQMSNHNYRGIGQQYVQNEVFSLIFNRKQCNCFSIWWSEMCSEGLQFLTFLFSTRIPCGGP